MAFTGDSGSSKYGSSKLTSTPVLYQTDTTFGIHSGQRPLRKAWVHCRLHLSAPQSDDMFSHMRGLAPCVVVICLAHGSSRQLCSATVLLLSFQILIPSTRLSGPFEGFSLPLIFFCFVLSQLLICLGWRGLVVPTCMSFLCFLLVGCLFAAFSRLGNWNPKLRPGGSLDRVSPTGADHRQTSQPTNDAN